MSTATNSIERAPVINDRAGHMSQTVCYFAAFVALGLTIGSFGPTLPGLAAQVRAHLGRISFLFMARSLGYLLGSLRGGRLYDRVPGHALMAAVLVVMAAMMALVPLAPALWLLTIILLGLGAAEGALDVGGNVLLVHLYGKRVAPYMNALHFFFGVGAFLAPVVVAQAILFTNGVKLSYWALAAALLPVALLLLRVPAPARRPEAAVETSEQPPSSRLIITVALFLFLYVGAEVSFGGWVYTYTITLNLSGMEMAAYLTSAFWGALTLGRLLSIPLASRFRPGMILLFDLMGSLLSVGVILFGSESFTAILVGAISLGLAMASIFPTTLSLAERRIKITGRITGFFIVGASAGSMFLPWLIGQLFEPFGPRSMMVVILATLLAAVGVLIEVLRSSTRAAQ